MDARVVKPRQKKRSTPHARVDARDTHQEVTPYGFMRTCNNCGFVFKQQ